jgi:hypothetical protein
MKNTSRVEERIDQNYADSNESSLSPKELSEAKKMIELKSRKLEIENEDKKQDAQRRMAWFSLVGMLLYPILVIVSAAIGFYEASEILGDMANVYFVSVAAIVAAFFGSQAYSSKKRQPRDRDEHLDDI